MIWYMMTEPYKGNKIFESMISEIKLTRLLLTTYMKEGSGIWIM